MVSNHTKGLKQEEKMLHYQYLIGLAGGLFISNLIKNKVHRILIGWIILLIGISLVKPV